MIAGLLVLLHPLHLPDAVPEEAADEGRENQDDADHEADLQAGHGVRVLGGAELLVGLLMDLARAAAGASAYLGLAGREHCDVWNERELSGSEPGKDRGNIPM